MARTKDAVLAPEQKELMEKDLSTLRTESLNFLVEALGS